MTTDQSRQTTVADRNTTTRTIPLPSIEITPDTPKLARLQNQLIGIESDDYDVNLLKEIVCADLHRDETGCPSNSIIRKASLITRFHQHPEIVALLFAGLEAPLLNQIDLDLTQELSIPIPDLQYPETPLYLEQLLDKEQPLLPPPNSWRPEGNVTQSQDTTSGLAAIRLKNVLS